MKVDVNSEQYKIDHSLVQEVIRQTLDELVSQGTLLLDQEIQISVATVEPAEIKKINKQWRKTNEETDVLSFCYEKNNNKIEGEVVLCPKIIKQNAESDGITFVEELIRNIIHSILHITGFKHGQKMFDLQNIILNDILNKDLQTEIN